MSDDIDFANQPNFPVNVSDYCPSDDKCVFPDNIKECCQSFVRERNPSGWTACEFTLNGKLFKFSKKESEYFRRVQRKERNTDLTDSEKFRLIEQAFLTDIDIPDEPFLEISKELNFSIVIPDFHKVIQQEGVTKADIFERNTTSKIHFEYDVYIQTEGRPVETEGFLSILFIPKLDNDTDFSIWNSLTCIASIVDKSGEERFTQSFVKEHENNIKSLFGFVRFVKCSTLLYDPDEFLLNDTLTIHCCVSRVEKAFMGQKIKLPNFPVNVSDYCPSDDKCIFPDNIKECCQSFVREQNPTGGITCKLMFNGLLFKILKKESEYFRRLPDVQMKESNTDFTLISRKQCERFRVIEQAFLTGFLAVPSTASCYKLYAMADKYGILCILNLCSSHLQAILDPFNVVKCFILADSHSDIPLKTAAIRYIRSHWSVVKTTEAWQFLDKKREQQLLTEIFQDIESNADEIETD